MTDRDWSKEMAKIDKQLESVSDAQLFPDKPSARPSQQAQVAAVARREAGHLHVVAQQVGRR